MDLQYITITSKLVRQAKSIIIMSILSYFILLWSTDRPNHDLRYPIGYNFCLEEPTDRYRFTIQCELESLVHPIANFHFHVTQNSSGTDLPLYNYAVMNKSETTQILVMNDGIDLTEGDITVVCQVINSNGNDNATTYISICGE